MARSPRVRRVYVDSSVWIAVLTQEPTAQPLVLWFAGESGQLITAQWTRTELASAMSIKARRGDIEHAATAKLLVEYDAWAGAEVQLLPADSADFLSASVLCADASSCLRAADALHLAIAMRCQATHIATLDKHLLKNAQSRGMENALPSTCL